MVIHDLPELRRKMQELAAWIRSAEDPDDLLRAAVRADSLGDRWQEIADDLCGLRGYLIMHVMAIGNRDLCRAMARTCREREAAMHGEAA